jgi:hypothetical protein
MTDGGRRGDSKYRSAARHRAAWRLWIGAGSRRRSARQAIDPICGGGVTLGRCFTICRAQCPVRLSSARSWPLLSRKAGQASAPRAAVCPVLVRAGHSRGQRASPVRMEAQSIPIRLSVTQRRRSLPTGIREANPRRRPWMQRASWQLEEATHHQG